MKSTRLTYIKNILMPCLWFSVITGVFTGGLIFCFKLTANYVIGLSNVIYSAVRQNPIYLPLMLLGAALLGGIVATVLRYAPICRGGGIPTSVAVLRGLIDFNWIKSTLLLFFSANLSFLCGIPLGNEGPSVQMGTAVGRGTVSVFAKKNRAWDRYMMTGGACAGFASATGAPISGIFFAFEEAHRRFSPMIFMVASMTVIASTITTRTLCSIVGISGSMFDFSIDAVLPMHDIWSAVLVGVICGLAAVLFTCFYRLVGRVLKKIPTKIPFAAKVVIAFTAVAGIGFVATQCIGSGHSLIEEVLHGNGIWYLLILIFCVRAILLVFANQIGISGGLFVPTLTFGAILGALCGKLLVATGLLLPQYYIIMVVIGMTAFLSAASRTPITAIVFAAEVLSGLSNILPITVGVTVSYMVIETVGITAFQETVIEGKVESARQGKTMQIVNAYLTVQPDAFAVGKEIRDILLPPTCMVLSVDRHSARTPGETGISEGDVLHVHYGTVNPDKTKRDLEDLFGIQTKDTRIYMHPGDDKHCVPEV